MICVAAVAENKEQGIGIQGQGRFSILNKMFRVGEDE